MIYLDNAATTFPKPEIVYKSMDDMNRQAVNSGRGEYKAAQRMSQIISDTKQKIRKLVKADINVPVVFSPSITIALNQIINGLDLVGGGNIYVSPYEHNAVARTVAHVSKNTGMNVIEMPLNASYEIDIDKLKYLFAKEKPRYIFCTHVSNVTGYILPVKEIFDEGKKYDSVNILDSAQSLGLLPINSQNLNVDIIAFAGHKTLYGPLGIGGFLNITGVKLKTFITGGTGSDSLNLEMPAGAETRYEPASANIVAIAGLQAALTCLDQEAVFNHEKQMTEYLIEKLMNIKGVRILGPKDTEQRIGIVSIVFDNFASDDAGMILDEDFDIAVRTGYHCSPYIHKYLNDQSKRGTVRISLGQFNSLADINKLIVAIKDIA